MKRENTYKEGSIGEWLNGVRAHVVLLAGDGLWYRYRSDGKTEVLV